MKNLLEKIMGKKDAARFVDYYPVDTMEAVTELWLSFSIMIVFISIVVINNCIPGLSWKMLFALAIVCNLGLYAFMHIIACLWTWKRIHW